MEIKPVKKVLPVKSILSVSTEDSSLPLIVQLPLVDTRPCLNFVNTIDWRLSPERSRDCLADYSCLLAFSLRLNILEPAQYSTLSERAQRSPKEGERSFADARAFRDAFTALIDETAGTPMQEPLEQPRRDALMIFDAARKRAKESERLIWNNGELHLVPRADEEGLDYPWLCIVRDAEQLALSEFFSRVRVCAADGCGWAFVDTSKNGKRRWCSMQLCGNREKARRFKAKEEEGPPLE